MTSSNVHRLLRSARSASAVLPAAAQVSPEILPDGRVTFRYRAKNALDVKAADHFGDAVVQSGKAKPMIVVPRPTPPAS